MNVRQLHLDVDGLPEKERRKGGGRGRIRMERKKARWKRKKAHDLTHLC